MSHSENLPLEPGSDLVLGDFWDAHRIRDLVREKAHDGLQPSFLYLGEKEAGLLRAFLGKHFGGESVASLKDLYYLDMEVVVVPVVSLFRLAGVKRNVDYWNKVDQITTWRRASESGGKWDLAL